MDFENVDDEDGIADLLDVVPEVDEDRIEFTVPEGHKGQFEAPAPASEFLPSWYKQLERWMDGDETTSFQMTVAGCRPFFDAINFGWVIPTPVDIMMTADDDLDEWEASWNGDYDAMGSHPLEQIGGKMFPGDSAIIVKFNNPWLVRTPPGYSTLFMPVLNRPELPFHTFSGVVETDKYHNTINFPALWTESGFDEKIEAGTPVVQAIPFKRDSVLGESIRRTQSEDEEDLNALTGRKVSRTTGFYSGEVWEAKEGERDVTNHPDVEAPEGTELDTET
jgi:hypothetical protein